MDIKSLKGTTVEMSQRVIGQRSAFGYAYMPKRRPDPRRHVPKHRQTETQTKFFVGPRKDRPDIKLANCDCMIPVR
jgi:hypothetical protein